MDNNNPNSILLITQDFPPIHGGIQTYSFQLAQHLHRLGYPIHVICPAAPLCKNFDASLPFLVTRVKVHSTYLWINLLFFLPRYIRLHKPQVLLYSQWQNGLWNLLPSLLKSSSPMRQVCLVHGRELLTSAFLKLTPLLARKVFRYINLALPNSRAVNRLLKNVSSSLPTEIVHPGVDFSRLEVTSKLFLKQKLGWENCFIVGVITRLIPRKNVSALLRITAKLKDQHPQLRVLIGGQGPLFAQLKQESQSLGITDLCFFAEAIPEELLGSYYSTLDLFIMPSLSYKDDIEGFGIVYLEAAVLGIPSLAYNSGGVGDAIDTPTTGILVPEGDEEALAQELHYLIENPELVKKMGLAAQARAQTFTWENNAQRIAELIG